MSLLLRGLAAGADVDATKLVRLSLSGLAGVVNRSQHDINTNRDMKEAISAEAAFFDSR